MFRASVEAREAAPPHRQLQIADERRSMSLVIQRRIIGDGGHTHVVPHPATHIVLVYVIGRDRHEVRKRTPHSFLAIAKKLVQLKDRYRWWIHDERIRIFAPVPRILTGGRHLVASHEIDTANESPEGLESES